MVLQIVCHIHSIQVHARPDSATSEKLSAFWFEQSLHVFREAPRPLLSFPATAFVHARVQTKKAKHRDFAVVVGSI